MVLGQWNIHRKGKKNKKDLNPNLIPYMPYSKINSKTIMDFR